MNIKDTKDTLVVIASVAVIAFVGDALNTKYNMGDKTVICTSPEVEKSLLKIVTPEVNDELKKQGFTIDTSVLRENTSTELATPTVNGQSKYSCNTSIEIKLKALPDNKKAQETIANFTDNQINFTKDFDYTVTPNDLGTQFWVKSSKIIMSDIKNNIEKYKDESLKQKEKQLLSEVSKLNLNASVKNETFNVKFNLEGDNKTIVTGDNIIHVAVDSFTTDEANQKHIKGHLIPDNGKTWDITVGEMVIFYDDPIRGYTYRMYK